MGLCNISEDLATPYPCLSAPFPLPTHRLGGWGWPPAPRGTLDLRRYILAASPQKRLWGWAEPFYGCMEVGCFPLLAFPLLVAKKTGLKELGRL